MRTNSTDTAPLVAVEKTGGRPLAVVTGTVAGTDAEVRAVAVPYV